MTLPPPKTTQLDPALMSEVLALLASNRREDRARARQLLVEGYLLHEAERIARAFGGPAHEA